jgi:hypothetical protein
LAEPPEESDSLILDFYSVPDQAWKQIWSVPGPGTTGAFSRQMFKIDDPEYLQKGFRFRFRNLASQFANNDLADKRANVDIWNIDYVILDRNRNENDTVLRDVSFMKPVYSILKEYANIPWTHFKDAFNTQRAPFIEVILKNHDFVSRNIGIFLEIRDILNPVPVYKLPVFNNDIAEGDSIHYKYSYNYSFKFGTGDSAAYEIKSIIQTDFFDLKANDTLRHIQEFYDYYALDDGTCEASYGLRGAGTKDASSALKFNAFSGDTLRAIDFYFVQILDSLNLDYYFYLNAWDDDNGKPGNLILNQVGIQPKYSASLNKFIRYQLETPVYIEGLFYIGFTQTDEKMLNVGLDLNTENKPRIFNNADNGEWKTTVVLPGTPMMRPVFQHEPVYAGVRTRENQGILVYPNPADSYFSVLIQNESTTSNALYELYDISGRLVKSGYTVPGKNIETAGIPDGIYLYRVKLHPADPYFNGKIIITHRDVR